MRKHSFTNVRIFRKVFKALWTGFKGSDGIGIDYTQRAQPGGPSARLKAIQMAEQAHLERFRDPQSPLELRTMFRVYEQKWLNFPKRLIQYS